MSIWSGISSFMRWAGRPLYDISKSTINTATGGAIERAEQKATAATEAQKAADLATQQLRIQRSASERNAAIADRQRDLEAEQISEQSRSAAVGKFQAESAGEAELAAGGMAEGSSPYVALEASLNETGRQISAWFKQADTGLLNTGDQLASQLEAERYGERALTFQAESARDTASEIKQGFWGDFALDMAGGVLGTVLSAYQLGSNIEGIKMFADQQGMGLWDMGGTILSKAQGSMGSSAVLKIGGALQYGAVTGDTSPLTDMFADGGIFGKEIIKYTKPMSGGIRSPLQLMGVR